MTTVAVGPEDGSAKPSTTVTSPKVPDEARAPRDNRGTEQREANSAAEQDQFEAATALPHVFKIVGSLVAPTTLLTALLFYFGLMFAIGYFRYLGVNWTVLNLPVQNYLLLSASSSIIPLIYVTGGALLAIWLYQLPLQTFSAGARWFILRALMPSVATAGLVLVSLAMVDFWYPVFPMYFPEESRGLSLSIGALLLPYAARLRRVLSTERPAEAPRALPVGIVVAKWGGVFILVSAGLFWAVSSYAITAGDTMARGLETALSCSPDVVLYSEKNLSLQVPGVQEVISRSPDAAYRYRYHGLKLVPQSGNQYLFLPAGWTHTEGVAILLPRSEVLWLEFSQPVEVRDGIC